MANAWAAKTNNKQTAIFAAHSIALTQTYTVYFWLLLLLYISLVFLVVVFFFGSRIEVYCVERATLHDFAHVSYVKSEIIAIGSRHVYLSDSFFLSVVLFCTWLFHRESLYLCFEYVAVVCCFFFLLNWKKKLFFFTIICVRCHLDRLICVVKDIIKNSNNWQVSALSHVVSIWSYFDYLQRCCLCRMVFNEIKCK